jgi:hypothetical protein
VSIWTSLINHLFWSFHIWSVCCSLVLKPVWDGFSPKLQFEITKQKSQLKICAINHRRNRATFSTQKKKIYIWNNYLHFLRPFFSKLWKNGKSIILIDINSIGFNQSEQTQVCYFLLGEIFNSGLILMELKAETHF